MMSWPAASTLPDVGRHDAADDADQRRFAGPIGAQQGEDFAALDIQAGGLEGLYAGGVRLGEVLGWK